MTDNQIEQIKNQIFRDNRNAMRIARVPAIVRSKFEEIAKADFADNYGMFLMHLMSMYVLENATERLSALELRIEKLEKLEEKT